MWVKYSIEQQDGQTLGNYNLDILLTRQREFLELAARRRQWVSSTETPVDKSLIGALSGNKILSGGLSGVDAGVDVVVEQSPLKPSHFKLQSSQDFGVP